VDGVTVPEQGFNVFASLDKAGKLPSQSPASSLLSPPLPLSLSLSEKQQLDMAVVIFLAMAGPPWPLTTAIRRSLN